MTFFFPVQRLSPHPAPLSSLVLAWTVPHQREGKEASQEVSVLFTSNPNSRQAEDLLFLPVGAWPGFSPSPGTVGVIKGRPCF